MSELLKEKFMVVPGVFNPFTALQAERAGFRAAYLSGGALTSSMGIPDIGLISLRELSDAVRQIREVTDIPLIVDADTGFGNALSVWRTVRVLEESGADAIQIEDQKAPKRCGHLEGKELIDAEEMGQKIRAAVDARRNALIIARTDSRAVEGMEGAINRARKYYDSGADIIFPEALLSRQEFSRFSKSVDAPLLANMTEFGKTPLIDSSFFRKAGYRYVIFPVTAFRAAALAVEHAFTALASDGTQRGIITSLMTREKQYEIIRYHDYELLDRQISSDDVGAGRRRRTRLTGK
ncbi:MAG: methylisocitrate lyase [Thermoplasmata archaeon]|uniref:Methylisocitrate lyase n=1 Tax=Candidatus Sysuiplasma superficiale TaxID=2823368 RepID=A0A8J7YTI0_9ARCH|nr:methylisocitrate lyase [Candidatus Sysuiplasma superficiale]MCL4347269.1 methylisocitrate lyase [Candidatus Thermoplasmatota archaeon]